jgi:hypothetical protein
MCRQAAGDIWAISATALALPLASYFVGHLLRIAWLQRRQRGQELALAVDETEHVGDIAVRQLLVERLLAHLLVLALGLLRQIRVCVSLS